MYYYMTATCLFGLEGLVSQELKFMGAENVCAENGRVFFEGDEICQTSYKDRGGKYQGQVGVTLPKT